MASTSKKTPMEDLIIKGCNDIDTTPTVRFTVSNGICELDGDSYMEKTYEFYQPLLNWLNNYFEKVKKPLTFNVRLNYYNTSSSKALLQIFKLLYKYQKQGNTVEVNWFYMKNDIDTAEEVEDYEIATNLKIKSIYI